MRNMKTIVIDPIPAIGNGVHQTGGEVVLVIDSSGNHNNAFHFSSIPPFQSWTDGVPGILPGSICAYDGNLTTGGGGGAVTGSTANSTWSSTNMLGVEDQTMVILIKPGPHGDYVYQFVGGPSTVVPGFGSGHGEFAIQIGVGDIKVFWSSPGGGEATGTGLFDPSVEHLFVVRALGGTGHWDAFVDGVLVFSNDDSNFGPYSSSPTFNHSQFEADQAYLQGFAWFPRALSDGEIAGIPVDSAPNYQSYLQGLGPDVLYMLDEQNAAGVAVASTPTLESVQVKAIWLPSISAVATGTVPFS